jgi:hypothetical protein
VSVKKVYIEGGGDSKELRIRCREGFRKLLEKCGLTGRLPALTACGGRDAAFDDFRTACANAKPSDYVALLVDSEDPVADIEKPWQHLKVRDNWDKPNGATDDQALMMTTCMETWIVADRKMLRERYTDCLQENALPSLSDGESRTRSAVLESLKLATRTCKSPFAKGAESFRLIASVDPNELSKHLPSFARVRQILREHL